MAARPGRHLQRHAVPGPGAPFTSPPRKHGPTSWDDPLRGAGPDPLDIPTDEQGRALAALDSGRWTVEPGTSALSSHGDGPAPSDALGLVRELRVRDWIDADGEVTLVGRHALQPLARRDRPRARPCDTRPARADGRRRARPCLVLPGLVALAVRVLVLPVAVGRLACLLAAGLSSACARLGLGVLCGFLPFVLQLGAAARARRVRRSASPRRRRRSTSTPALAVNVRERADEFATPLRFVLSTPPRRYFQPGTSVPPGAPARRRRPCWSRNTYFVLRREPAHVHAQLVVALAVDELRLAELAGDVVAVGADERERPR